MRARSIALASLLGAASVVGACTVGNRPTAATAAVLTGTAVGAVALNRAVTGDCWSSCPYGRVCDHESGMCVEASAVPRLVRDAGDDGDGDADAAPTPASSAARPD